MWVVGVGASAGGIEALRELLPVLPKGNLAYVVAQHMSPVHPSLLIQVLARETELEVAEISDGMPLRNGVIFVAAPNSDVRLVGNTLRTETAEPRISPQPSIDNLLESIADQFGKFSVGVVLSGTGSDGVLGIESIQRAGGRTLVQDPETARYRDMPTASIDSGCVDLVLKPAEMGDALASIVAGEAVMHPEGRFSADPVMAALARETRRATGWDLASYKEGTLGRQLAKRIGSLGLQTIEDYLAYTQDKPEELTAFRDSMLITVTEFMRDKLAFDALRATLVGIVAAKSAGDTVRAWVAGCATGEEAYSIAIVLAEAVREAGMDLPVKVFATDISEAAMDTARRGAYPTASLEHVPNDWVRRYFTIDGDRAQVGKRLRDMLVIARQDVTRDPPLVRMDLVSCRNLLIYLIPSVQSRVLANLHAALYPDAILFLGRSEAIPAELELFTTVSATDRLFRRIGASSSIAFGRFPAAAALPPPTVRTSSQRLSRDAMRDGIRDRLLEEYAPPSLLIDSSGTPVHQIGEVGRFLRLPDPNGDYTFSDMIIPALRTEITTLLSRVSRNGQAQAGHVVVIRDEAGMAERLRLQLTRVTVPGSVEPYALVSFVPEPMVRSESPTRRPPVNAEPGDGIETPIDSLLDQVSALEHELVGTREHLQAVVEELESSNEELQAMNEELQASSEELQATNEELETTNEELQATNEELTTVNETLEVRTSELYETNIVLGNIQSSVLTAVVLLDAQQRVQRFSPLAVKVFGLVKQDIGTRLSRLPSHLDMADLSATIERVMESGEGHVSEVSSPLATYLLQVMPYVDNDVTTGAVLALSDITELAQARSALAGRAEEFRLLADAVPHMVYRTTLDMRSAQYVSPSITDLFGVSADDALADFGTITALVHPDDAPRVRENVAAHPDTGYAIDYRIVRPDGELRVVRDISRILRDVDGRATHRIGTAIDVTDLQTAIDEADHQRQRAEGVFTRGGMPMATMDEAGAISSVNGYLCALLAADEASLLGLDVTQLVEADDAPELAAALHEGSVTDAPVTVDRVRFRCFDDETRFADVSIARISRRDGASALLLTLHDVTAEEAARLDADSRAAEVEAVFTRTAAPMALVGLDGLMIRPNQAMCDLLGYTERELSGQHISDMAYPDDVAADLSLFGELIRGDRTSYATEKRFLAKDGTTIWGRLMLNSAQIGPGSQDRILINTILDITLERSREAAALRIAQSDSLTGLANRALVFDRLRQATLRAQRTGERVSVLFIDLEGFKGINDRFGHDVGDAVLTAVAARLQRRTRAGDSIGRLGGDEFLVVAQHESAEAAHESFRLAEKLRDAICDPLLIPVVGQQDLVITVTASIGAAQFPSDGSEVEELVRKADIAMYSAKQRGGNQVRFYSDRLEDHARHRAAQRAEIHSAIDENQFMPYFQPVIDAHTDAPVGAEVLARWVHPHRGVLAPIDFLEATTALHLLDGMTGRILAQVVAELPAIRAACAGLQISVNLAPEQLRGAGTVDMILGVVGMDLSGWKFEVTETTAFGSDRSIIENLQRLRAAGAHLSLDDFGTGYSSVSRLRAFGFDEVKIDREFVMHSGDGAVPALVVAMIDMAHALGASAVAEGIETESQSAALRELGADRLQGYHFGRPMAAAQLVSWLKEHA